jgi:DNA (cytosine-5)-methyltransferase 1
VTYYNEIDSFAADWLTELGTRGHVTGGTVDRRDIREVQPDDIRAYARAHFFAGIGGWDLALRLSGWPDDASVWTGSCPCQPFSAAGRHKGEGDARHLWPELFRLVRECRPPVLFGEQVASPAGLAWLDAVSADLEGAGYAVGAADLCAAGVGAPHIRQRLYFVAVADGERLEGLRVRLQSRRPLAALPQAGRGGEADGLADAERDGSGQRRGRATLEGRTESRRATIEPDRLREGDAWGIVEWLPCLDGKLRPAEPGTFPLAHGVPGRVGRLRGYGNAIVPQVAATFVRAVIDDLCS